MKKIECSEPTYKTYSLLHYGDHLEFKNYPVLLKDIADTMHVASHTKNGTHLFKLTLGEGLAWFYNNKPNLEKDIERIKEALYLESPEGKREQMAKVFLEHLNKTLKLIDKDSNYKAQLLIKIKLDMLKNPNDSLDNEKLYEELDKLIAFYTIESKL